MDKCLEDFRGSAFDIPDPLRMPLYAPYEFLAGIPDGFDDAVLTVAHDLETGGQILDRLMVMTVDADGVRSCQGAQRGVGDDDTVVAAAVVRLGHPVLDRTGTLGGNILVESTAETDIHQLDSPADTEDG